MSQLGRHLSSRWVWGLALAAGGVMYGFLRWRPSVDQRDMVAPANNNSRRRHASNLSTHSNASRQSSSSTAGRRRRSPVVRHGLATLDENTIRQLIVDIDTDVERITACCEQNVIDEASTDVLRNIVSHLNKRREVIAKALSSVHSGLLATHQHDRLQAGHRQPLLLSDSSMLGAPAKRARNASGASSIEVVSQDNKVDMLYPWSHSSTTVGTIGVLSESDEESYVSALDFDEDDDFSSGWMDISSISRVGSPASVDAYGEARSVIVVPILEPDRLLYYQSLDVLRDQRAKGGDEAPLCRTMRTRLLGCASDDEFVAKLVCLRNGFTTLMKNVEFRRFWVSEGSDIIQQLLRLTGRTDDVPAFVTAYEDVVKYVEDRDNVSQMMKELSNRGVTCCNFFDIVIDYILIDSLQDLDCPPASVTAVMGNRWLSSGFKQSALNTAIWGMIKTKRAALASATGFKSKFYDITSIVTPALAWAFFGPNDEVRDVVIKVKMQVIALARDLFSFECVEFTSEASVVNSIKDVSRRHLAAIHGILAVGS